VGQEGLKAPLSFLLALAFAFRIITFVADLALGLANGTRIASLGGAFCIWVFLMIGMFVWAGMVHLVTRMFNGQGGFGGSFRAVTYAQAPTMILGAIAYIFLASSVADMMKKPGGPGALSLAIYAPQVVVRPVQLAQAGPPGLPGGPPAGFPGGPGSSFPGGGMPGPGGRSPQEAQAILARLVGMFLLPLLIYSLGGIWTLVLTGMGVAHIHGTGNGATVGILFIANLVANVIATIIGFVLGGAIMAVLIPALQNMRR